MIVESKPFAPQKIDTECLLCGSALTLGLFKYCTREGCNFVLHVQILGTPGFAHELRKCPSCDRGNGRLIGHTPGGQDVWECFCQRIWTAPPPARQSTHAFTRSSRARNRARELQLATCDCGNYVIIDNIRRKKHQRLCSICRDSIWRVPVADTFAYLRALNCDLWVDRRRRSR